MFCRWGFYSGKLSGSRCSSGFRCLVRHGGMGSMTYLGKTWRNMKTKSENLYLFFLTSQELRESELVCYGMEGSSKSYAVKPMILRT